MRWVKLSDVIVRANTKVDKDNTDLVYYVGGEHFESGELMVDQKGIIAGSTIGPMFYYGFKAGQFLLVSRNPHLKKAGIVEFDGICSEKTFVLQSADENVLLPEYLPFVLQNDCFWKYAVDHKHGSTNFFINWSTLANYEFSLPSIEVQKDISEVAWAAYELKKKYKNLLESTDNLVKSQFIEMFGERFKNNRVKLTKLGDFTIGLTYKPENATEEGTIVLRSGNIQNSELTLENDIVRVSGVKIPENKYIQPNDILMCSRNGSAVLVGKTCLIRRPIERMTFGAFMTVIRSRFPAFMFGFFQTDYFKDQLTNVGTTSINQITTKMLNNYEAVMPTEDEERRFAKFLEQSDKSKFVRQEASNWGHLRRIFNNT